MYAVTSHSNDSTESSILITPVFKIKFIFDLGQNGISQFLFFKTKSQASVLGTIHLWFYTCVYSQILNFAWPGFPKEAYIMSSTICEFLKVK